MSFAIFLKRIYIKLDQVEQKSIQSSWNYDLYASHITLVEPINMNFFFVGLVGVLPISVIKVSFNCVTTFL
jgi:hypothetical protein